MIFLILCAYYIIHAYIFWNYVFTFDWSCVNQFVNPIQASVMKIKFWQNKLDSAFMYMLAVIAT